MSITSEEYRRLYGKKKKSKYRNIRSICSHDHKHRSKLEASVCGLLHRLVQRGLSRSVQVEVPIYLTLAKIKYVVDFKVTDYDGEVKFYEAKGVETEKFKIIKKLWKYYGPGVLRIIKGPSSNLDVFEVIRPLEIPPQTP